MLTPRLNLSPFPKTRRTKKTQMIHNASLDLRVENHLELRTINGKIVMLMLRSNLNPCRKTRTIKEIQMILSVLKDLREESHLK